MAFLFNRTISLLPGILSVILLHSLPQLIQTLRMHLHICGKLHQPPYWQNIRRASPEIRASAPLYNVQDEPSASIHSNAFSVLPTVSACKIRPTSANTV